MIPPIYDFLEADPNYRPLYFDAPAPPPQGRQRATSTARAGQGYEAGMDDYFPGLNLPRQAANTARRRQAYTAGMDDYFPGLEFPNPPRASRGFTAGGRINPGTVAHSLTNLDSFDAVFLLGSAPFTYANYKSFGATNPQALIGTVGTEGGGVLGGLAGARLGATLGAPLGPWGASGGAILGAVMGGQAGFRLGGKAADEMSGLNEANRMRQQQQFYDPTTGEVYMPPPPPTPQEKLRSEILASAQNPYMPYMMAQLGGYYA